jgi:hypothetical protein
MTGPDTVYLDTYSGQNWLITPAAVAVGKSPPTTILDQKWLLVLSGIVEANLQGNPNGGWLNQNVSFLPGNSSTPDLGYELGAGPLYYAINHYSIPTPSDNEKDYYTVFSLEDGSWAPFVGLSAIFDKNESINAGYAVNDWRPNHFYHALNYPQTNEPINNIFTGINVDVGVSDTDAFILKLSYNITLVGTIAFAATGTLGP